jgi:hypothetical protein
MRLVYGSNTHKSRGKSLAICRNQPCKVTTKAGFALLVAAVLAGCTTANEPSSSGAIDTGTYPNLNIRPDVANEQLTAGQTRSKSAALRAAQRANASGSAPPPNDLLLLRKIGQTHGQEALDEIEGK